MGQPGNPYHNPEFGGQQPWGQPGPSSGQDPWGQRPAPGWGPSPGPGHGAPDSWNGPAAPAGPPLGMPPGPGPAGWPQGGFQPPAPKSNTGLIVGLVAGVAVLLMLLAVGAIYLFGGQEEPPPAADPSPSVSPSESPSPSPSPTSDDPAALDNEDTDETPLRTSHMFPDATFTGSSGEKYTLAGTLEANACTGTGGARVKDLMERYDCDRMVVGVYLDDTEKLFSGLLVIPFADSEDAEAVEGEILEDKQEHINSLTYYCPSTGKPGAKQCKRKADNPPTWYASFKTFHRYLLVSISLYTDGHRAKELDDVDQMTSDIVVHVTEAMVAE